MKLRPNARESRNCRARSQPSIPDKQSRNRSRSGRSAARAGTRRQSKKGLGGRGYAATGCGRKRSPWRWMSKSAAAASAVHVQTGYTAPGTAQVPIDGRRTDPAEDARPPTPTLIMNTVESGIGKPQGRPETQAACLLLDRLDVGGLLALRSCRYVERYGLAFLQRLETARLDRREVGEQVLTAIIRRDESKPLLSLNHFTLPFAIEFSSLKNLGKCHRNLISGTRRQAPRTSVHLDPIRGESQSKVSACATKHQTPCRCWVTWLSAHGHPAGRHENVTPAI